MFVKKFEAESMEEALSQVKRELGPHALILSTQNKPGKLFGRAMVEVTAALDKRKQEGEAKAKNEGFEDGFDEREILRVFPHRRQNRSPEAEARAVVNKYAEVSEAEREETGEAGAGKKPLVPSRQAERFEAGFLDLGFASETAKEFARRLVFDYARKDLSHASFLQRARIKLVAGGLRTLGPESLEGHESWVTIGMPGAGKTSVLVKLALYLRSRKRALSLVSLDARKMTGRHELLGYARLIKVPFAAEAEGTAGKCQLIDGPALAFPREDEGAELEKVCQRRNVCLVLDATQRLSEMQRVADHARRYNPTAIAFTRLDIVSQAGVIYDLLKSTKLPLLGVSLSRAFTTPFKFFEPAELASFLLSHR